MISGFQRRAMEVGRVRDAANKAYDAWISAWAVQRCIKEGSDYQGQPATVALALRMVRRAQRRDRILKALASRYAT